MENANNTYGLSFKRKIEDADVTRFRETAFVLCQEGTSCSRLARRTAKLMVAISSHEASYAIEDMARFYGCAVEPVLTPADGVVGAIHRFTRSLPDAALRAGGHLGREP